MNQFTLAGFISIGVIIILILNGILADYIDRKYNTDMAMIFFSLCLIELISLLFILGAIIH